MQKRLIAVGLILAIGCCSWAQRLSGSDTFADVGFGFGCLSGGSGIASCQFITVRGERDLPPRTGADGIIRNITVINSTDPFGRVALLWSGWRSHGDPDAEYWLRGIKNPSPIYEAAQVGDTFNFGDNTLHGYMWNGSYWHGAYRAVQAGVYAQSAPRPSIQVLNAPWWNIGDYRARDLLPNRPGVQIDPCLNLPNCDRTGLRCRNISFLNLRFSTGLYAVARSSITLFQIVGLDQQQAVQLSSPFRDDVQMEAALLVQGQQRQQASANIVFYPGNSGTGTIANQDRNWAQYGLPPRGLYHLEYRVQLRHIPYDKNGFPIQINPTLDPVEYFRQADRVYFDLRHLYYRATGAYNQEGTYNDSDLPPVCIPKQPGSLDITLNLSDFGLPYDYTVTLGGRRIDANTIEWALDEQPNRCVNVQGVNVLIYRVWGRLRANLQLVPAEWNGSCARSFNLLISPVDGDAGNQLNGELYALCWHNDQARIDVEVRQIDYTARGGQPDALPPDNPHILYTFTDSEDVEFMLYGDANGDGAVDDADLLTVLFEFGRAGRDLAGDVNGDSVVDDTDILIVLFQFGRTYGDCCRNCPPPE